MQLLYSRDIKPCRYYTLNKFEVLNLCNFLHRILNIANFHFQALEYASMYDFVLVSSKSHFVQPNVICPVPVVPPFWTPCYHFQLSLAIKQVFKYSHDGLKLSDKLLIIYLDTYSKLFWMFCLQAIESNIL